MGQIFISYARKDEEFVDRLVRDVEASEMDVWIDRADIRGGDGWAAAISRALSECSSFLLILSPDSSKSRNVVKEVLLADEYEKQIIPLKLGHCEVPEKIRLALAGQQWIDFAEDYADGLRRLLDALGREHPPQEQEQQQRPPSADEPQKGSVTHPNPETGSGQPRPLQLAEVLPGQWSATIMAPMMYPLNVMFWLAPDGSFRAQQLQTGSVGQGAWSVNYGSQVFMQGVEAFGVMSRPLVMMFTVTQFDRENIAGIGPNREQVAWRRVG